MSRRRAPTDAAPHLLEYAWERGLLDWAEVFGNDRPIELEIGSGKGLFLANQATLHADRNFFGIEISRKYARKAAERAARNTLTNVRLWSGDARPFLAHCVPAQSLAAVHVYFPDPWWKARHKKRRVFTRSLVEDAQSGLLDGGFLKIATDVEEYFQVILALLTEFPGFAPIPVEPATAPRHELDYLTNFERKYRIEGRPIFRCEYQLDRARIPLGASVGDQAPPLLGDDAETSS